MIKELYTNNLPGILRYRIMLQTRETVIRSFPILPLHLVIDLSRTALFSFVSRRMRIGRTRSRNAHPLTRLPFRTRRVTNRPLVRFCSENIPARKCSMRSRFGTRNGHYGMVILADRSGIPAQYEQKYSIALQSTCSILLP
mgnify:CR=1 FL=1